MTFSSNNGPPSEKTPSLKILVADDDPLNRRLMQVLLGREGHEVDVAANGLEAFDAVKFQTYDLVFMDLQMPVMDGMEASRRIREWENDGQQHTFIIALTASYLPEEGHRLFEAGIDNYISKPFQLDHIERMLKYSAAARTISLSSSKVTFPQKLSSKEILEIQNGIDNPGSGDPPLRDVI
ncbi:MAG TPA: response regulator [Anaerolineales bacterium]|nr:response regulator [Anaerolineales bacterium]